MGSMAFRICRAALCLALITTAARADFIDLWANKLDMPLNKAPRVGHSRVLLIPVQIDYSGPAGAFAPIDMARLGRFFTDAPAPAASALNFNGFFQIASSGRYQPEVTVAPLVRYNGCPAMLAGSADCSIAR
jgi:hypothetical protein